MTLAVVHTVGAGWTPQTILAVITGVTALVAAIVAGIISIIKAARGQAVAGAAILTANQAETNSAARYVSTTEQHAKMAQDIADLKAKVASQNGGQGKAG